MKTKVFRILSVVVLILVLAAPVLAAEVEMTIIGEVNDNYQLVTDQGEVYEVADTDSGNDLLENIGKKVKVTGTVAEEEGIKTITVASFVLLEDKQ